MFYYSGPISEPEEIISLIIMCGLLVSAIPAMWWQISKKLNVSKPPQAKEDSKH